MGGSGAFRSIFALEDHDSSQIDPCAAGKGPQFMLPLTSVAGLVVPGVEAELEDGGLDVVPFPDFDNASPASPSLFLEELIIS